MGQRPSQPKRGTDGTPKPTRVPPRGATPAAPPPRPTMVPPEQRDLDNMEAIRAARAHLTRAITLLQ